MMLGIRVGGRKCSRLSLTAFSMVAAVVIAALSPSSARAAIVCNGVTDAAPAINAALAAGTPFSLPAGRCRIASTLTVTKAASNGQSMTGQGPTAADGSGAGRTIIVPDAAVTPAILIDGAPFGGYVQNLVIAGLAIDMVNMPDTVASVAVAQKQAFDIQFNNVRTLNNGTVKRSWRFYPGAFTTELRGCAGGVVEWLASGANDPTTTTLVNCDLRALQANYAANITLIGGAVQPFYYQGMPIAYLAPGVSPGGYPNTAGLYVAIASSFANVAYLTSVGADWENGGGFPATFNDGIHGTLPLAPVVQTQASVTDATFINPNFAGLYLYDQTGSTLLVGYQAGGGGGGNFFNAPVTLNRSLYLNGGQAISGFSDNRVTQTLLLDSSTGGSIFTGMTLRPQAAGDQTLCIFNTTAQCVFDFAQNGAGALYLNQGTQLSFNTGNESGQTLNIGGTGLIVGYGATGGETLRITPANGTASLSNAFFPGSGAGEQTSAGFLGGAGNPDTSMGADGWFYFRGDCTAGTMTCVWHREAGAWTPVS